MDNDYDIDIDSYIDVTSDLKIKFNKQSSQEDCTFQLTRLNAQLLGYRLLRVADARIDSVQRDHGRLARTHAKWVEPPKAKAVSVRLNRNIRITPR